MGRRRRATRHTRHSRMLKRVVTPNTEIQRAFRMSHEANDTKITSTVSLYEIKSSRMHFNDVAAGVLVSSDTHWYMLHAHLPENTASFRWLASFLPCGSLTHSGLAPLALPAQFPRLRLEILLSPILHPLHYPADTQLVSPMQKALHQSWTYNSPVAARSLWIPL